MSLLPPSAMANPPRKAKRLRELAFREPAGEPAAPLPNLQLRAPTPPPSTTPRRGRKPAGPLSRSAREQLRKTNHSVIEKRRREKINEALAALRQLVPNDKPDGEKEEKEFKLEVLVRTVEYLRMVVARVNKLEAATCQNCGGPFSAAVASSSSLMNGGNVTPQTEKRKRPLEDEGEDRNVEDDGRRVSFTAAPGQSVISPGDPPAPQPLLRLPSISSWLYDPPSAAAARSAPAFQLPSPPQTVPFAPTNTSTGFLPGLALPPPIEPGYQPHPGTPDSARVSPLAGPARAHDRDVPDLPLDAPRNDTACPAPDQPPAAAHPGAGRRVRARPSSPSPWTRDDRTAASLLLNMSAHRASAPADRAEPHGGRARGVVLEAQTPSSVLGMVEGETTASGSRQMGIS